MQQVLEILRQILAAKGLQPDSVLKACEDVAGACGGFFGFGDKVSGDEADVINKISASFSDARGQKITDKLK